MRPLKALAAALAAWLCLSMGATVVGLGINESMPQRSISASFSGDDNDQIAWNYLKEKGFSDEAAAGIIGNWKWESAGGGAIKPTACQDGNSYDEYPEQYLDDNDMGYGIAQWSNAARSRGLVDYAKSQGLKSGDLKAQLGWFWVEVNDSHQGVLGLMSETDIDKACSDFQRIYEGAQVVAMGKRLEGAHAVYDRLHGTSGSGKAGAAGCTSVTVTAAAEQSEAVKAALAKVGCPYVGAAAGPDSFDCSGLVFWAFSQAGYDIPRLTADGYWNLCQPISEPELVPGDLVFWDSGWVNAGEKMGHVAIYMGDGQLVQALNTTYGVTKDFTIDNSMGSGNVYFGRLPK